MSRNETATEQQTPYGGFDDRGEPIVTGPHLMVTGMTGRGKTLRVLVPGALRWRGPRVLVSSKADFMKQTVTWGLARRGATMVMDLADEVPWDADWVKAAGVQRVLSDPTSLIDGDDSALAMSSLLMKTGSIGASDTGAGGGDDAFWQTQSAQPLAALLLAARASGGGIAWAVEAVGRPEADENHEDEPSWTAAIDIIEGSSRHAAALEQVATMDDKLKDSIVATMKAGLAPFLLDSVTGRWGAENVGTPFDPTMLESAGEPTLHIIAPADGVAAGAAVAVVETVIRHWRKGVEKGLPRVLLSIDEACNTCPIPKLPTYITEARGLGVACVIAVQSTHQMKLRWGHDGAEVLREVFPAVLILQGSPERELVEAAAWWSGEKDIMKTTTAADGSISTTTEHVPALDATDLLPHSLEEGRLLLYGQPGAMVSIPGIWNEAVWGKRPTQI